MKKRKRHVRVSIWHICNISVLIVLCIGFGCAASDSFSATGCDSERATQDGTRCTFVRARWDNGCPVYRMGAEGRARARQLSTLVAADLQQSDARAVLLGRVGSNAPQERFALRIGEAQGWWNYTHGGFAFRPRVDEDWVVVHLLNTCKEVSGVFVETLEEFFLDNPWEYRAIVALPVAAMQDALVELMLNRGLSHAFFENSVYSSISYPYSLERQNSTEYVLDVLASALAYIAGVPGVYDRATAKEYFLLSYAEQFQPDEIHSGYVERFGVWLGLGPDNVTFRDHPAQSKRANMYSFVSVGALIQFLNDVGMLQEVYTYALPDVEKAHDTIEIRP